eukprot:6398057-Amphidinium_carterae.1
MDFQHSVSWALAVQGALPEAATITGPPLEQNAKDTINREQERSFYRKSRQKVGECQARHPNPNH